MHDDVSPPCMLVDHIMCALIINLIVTFMISSSPWRYCIYMALLYILATIIMFLFTHTLINSVLVWVIFTSLSFTLIIYIKLVFFKQKVALEIIYVYVIDLTSCGDFLCTSFSTDESSSLIVNLIKNSWHYKVKNGHRQIIPEVIIF